MLRQPTIMRFNISPTLQSCCRRLHKKHAIDSDSEEDNAADGRLPVTGSFLAVSDSKGKGKAPAQPVTKKRKKEVSPAHDPTRQDPNPFLPDPAQFAAAVATVDHARRQTVPPAPEQALTPVPVPAKATEIADTRLEWSWVGVCSCRLVSSVL